jgi:SWI/SNF-related matrix-associated actin-dependent regulator of chromatin subfamily A containing DEAD/H box 1
MLRLGETKLALDEAVAGDTEDNAAGENETEKRMKRSLMSALRNQLLEKEGSSINVDAEGDIEMKEVAA